MLIFELSVGLLFAGVLLTLAAGRLGLPYPALLALFGTALAFVPGMPVVAIDPNLALALFVAPLLLDAAFDTSPRDLRDNWRPVVALVLACVAATTIAVAVLARLLLPDLPWAAAVALGAIVAPPDASAATAVLRGLRPPHRVLVILEGESLLNDASALLILRVALVALAGSQALWATAGLSLLACVGGVAGGWALARLYILMTRWVTDLPIAITLQFLATFGVWLVADASSLSPILTVVAYGMTLARAAPGRTRARARIASFTVWELVVLVLTVLAFIVAGLQLRAIWGHVGGPGLAGHGDAVRFAAGVTGAVIATRIAWVMGYNVAVQLKNRLRGPSVRREMMLPSWRSGVVVAWSGMRGIVTLAAALSLPDDMPRRDLLVFSAFAVVLVTLVLQGATLAPLLRLLRLSDSGPVEREVRVARAAASRAAAELLERAPASAARDILTGIYRDRLNDDRPDDTTLARLRLKAIKAERATLMRLRDSEAIGEHAYRQVQEELDWAEVFAAGERARGERPAETMDAEGPGRAGR